MALHTKKEFGDLCDKTTKELSVYASRGKIVYSGDYIDDSIQPNIDFLRRCLEKSKRKLEGDVGGIDTPKEKIIERKEKALIISAPIYRQPKTPNVRPSSDGDMSKYEASKLGEVLKNEKLAEEIDILREKKNKLQGVSIPKEPVLISFQYINKNMCRNIKVGLENLVTRYEKNFTHEQFAAIRTGIIKEINTAQKNAVEQSKKQIQEIIAISSTKKDVGERE